MATRYLDLNGLIYLVSKLKTLFAGKVDVEAGKGLSSNDFTSELKTKLEGIASGAQVNVIEQVKVNSTALTPASKAVSIPNASTSAYGCTKLSSATNSSVENLAATPKAVKTAYDLAASKQSPATTLAGYGITDAKIANGVITLGPNTITPLTSHQDISGKADKATTLSGYGITNAYTKAEVDAKLTSAMHYKGSVATVADLPSSNNQTGDFYNVTATGENYAWTGSDWDVTGSIIDLSNITNAEIDTVFAS